MVQEEKLLSNFVTSETQNKNQLLQESQCHLRRTGTLNSPCKIHGVPSEQEKEEG